MSLIQEWRALLKRPELPFIFAQLPNYTLEPDCDWPRLRDEQRRALTLWNTAMVVGSARKVAHFGSWPSMER
ncbi:hypothetical protein, partial [Bifidobacterium adolescentis]|uniref:hypothetical protein n=1 Tax=Bifidobacterium adolescentis TaxID=1680 RepID=UPI0022E82BBD